MRIKADRESFTGECEILSNSSRHPLPDIKIHNDNEREAVHKAFVE